MDPSALESLRRSYERGGLDESDVDSDPLRQFDRWLAEAVAAELPEPNAMVLATADGHGRPSARTVLLRRVDTGFVFFTNHTSRKATDLARNPQASLVFAWLPLERQVLVSGDVERVVDEDSAAYFRSRPRSHQIGAWASHQSSVIGSRRELEDRERELERRFAGVDVPVPTFWGGYRVVPLSVEFWQGRPGRLHDRLRFARSAEGDAWHLQRLAP